MEHQMTPSRPYLVRAFYDWLLDNDMTPQLLVNAEGPHVQVPLQFVKDGQIVLNIAPQAVVALSLENDAISFNARFGGVPHQLYIPMAAVLGLHSRENGAGTFFPPEPAYADWQETDSVTETASDKNPDQRPDGRPVLRVIK